MGDIKLKERHFTTFKRSFFDLTYFIYYFNLYFDSPDDYVDSLTFESGPVTHEERKELLQSINQYVPRRRSAKNGASAESADEKIGSQYF